ncbi:MAG: hypothetical protein E5X76_28940 [Mesorhizobium sp.]|nr:MAG: hypothetical protein E5X76_28940 [Mesorhizobium sp.]
MAKKLTAMDADILRSVFLNEVRDKKAPESEWRELATHLIQTYTGREEVDPSVLEWIISNRA